MNSNAISAKGFFSILFISRVISSIVFVVSTETSFADTDLILRSFAGAGILLITALPVYWYVRKFKNVDIIEAGSRISPIFGKLIAAEYWLASLYIALRTVSRFDLFASSIMFPETDMSFFILILLLACAYISMLGLRAIGRSSMIIVILFVGVTAVVAFSVIADMDMLNLTPLFNEGFGVYFKDSVISAAYGLDIALIPFFLPRIKGNLTKSFWLWLLAITLFIAITSFCVVTTLGAFANTQMFPSFSVSSLGKIGEFERLDSLETSLWICGIALKLGFVLFISTDALCRLLPRLKRQTALAVSTALLAAASLFISQDAIRFSYIVAQEQVMVLYAVVVMLAPLAVIVCSIVKERKKKRETAA